MLSMVDCVERASARASSSAEMSPAASPFDVCRRAAADAVQHGGGAPARPSHGVGGQHGQRDQAERTPDQRVHDTVERVGAR